MNVNDGNTQQQQSRTKKCHGNRSNQRFRRKCRARGMKAGKIEKFLQHRKENANTTDRLTTNNFNRQSVAVLATTVASGFNHKRKRDISVQDFKSQSTSAISKSISSISILQPSLKKAKTDKNLTTTNKKKTKKKIFNIPLKTIRTSIIIQNYRRPMYLKRSSATIFQMLSKILNYTFRSKKEQKFIYIRLNLFDQQYYLDVQQQSWQSYLTMSLQQQSWPAQVYKMAQTDNFALCQQYVTTYLETMKNQLAQCELELEKQLQLCPIRILSIDHINRCLKEYVHRQRKYLLIRNEQRLNKFKDRIQTNNVFIQNSSIVSTLNHHQKEIVHRLTTIRQQQVTIWKELVQLKIRVSCKFLPTNFDNLEDFLTPIHYTPLNNQRRSIELRNKSYKIIQETKRRWLDIHLNAYHVQIQTYDQHYEHEFKQFELNIRPRTMVTTTTITTADQSLSLVKKIQDYLTEQTNRLKAGTYTQISSYRKKLVKDRQHLLSVGKTMVGVSPSPYLDLLFNPCNKHQWRILSLGPSFIRLNQSATRPEKQQKIELEKLHKDIFQKVQSYLIEPPYSIRMKNPLFKQFSDRLLVYLQQAYFTPQSHKDQFQAQEQAETFSSIRKLIRSKQLILRQTDKGNNFYLGAAVDFEEKVEKFFSDTDAFKELSSNPFKENLDKIRTSLRKLLSEKEISSKQFTKMMPNREKVELAHLYFNPKTHKDGIPVRPIESTIHAATRNISKFLDEILRPIFDDKCQETTIIDGFHLITQLHSKYIDKNRLKPTTLFCTFDIHNLYTMLPQDKALNILMEFLGTHGYQKVQGINLNTIRKLASIVLKENVFAYANKFYQQTKGGAMGSSFTLTLANIFMWKWQQKFVDEQEKTGEFFGRYIDDIFITWNKSEKELIELLKDANTWQTDIRLDYKIGQSLPFLDVQLTNQNALLTTCVYHKAAAAPYVAPFVSDHPRHVFANIVQTALKRAVRYSSTLQIFQQEQRYIELMLLYNGYPSSFIDRQFRKFASEYLSESSFLPHINDQKLYNLLYRKLMNQPIRRPSQTARFDDVDAMDNTDIGYNEAARQQITASIRTNATSKKKIERLIVHYHHEKRFHSSKRDLHKVYDDTFKDTSAMDAKFIVANRNRRNAAHQLIRKRPKQTLLQDKPIKKRSRKKKEPTLNANNQRITTA